MPDDADVNYYVDYIDEGGQGGQGGRGAPEGKKLADSSQSAVSRHLREAMRHLRHDSTEPCLDSRSAEELLRRVEEPASMSHSSASGSPLLANSEDTF